MKKALLIGLALGLVTVWAVPAMAVDLTASGWIGFRGQMYRNSWRATAVYLSAFQDDQTGASITGRAHLQFKLTASADLYGVFTFRMDSGRLGSAAANEFAIVGDNQIAVRVNEVYIDFRIPPKLPLWMRVGMQAVAIRSAVFMTYQAPGVTVRAMIDPIKLGITGYYLKMADPDNWSAIAGGELYAFDANIPLSFGAVSVKPGMYFAYQDVRYAATDPTAQSLWWLGAYADGKIGPVNMVLDFAYSGGTNKMETTPEVAISSWLIRAVTSFVWNKLEVGVGGMYVQGEDIDTLDSEAFQLPGAPNYASESKVANGDTLIFNGGWFGTGGWGTVGLTNAATPDRDWPGFWDLRVFTYYQLFSWLKLGAQVAYIGDTQNGPSFGNPTGLDAIGNDADDDHSIGWEFDIGANIQLYKNLSLNTAFGYLVAHKALSLAGGVAPDDPWAFVARLYYSF